MFLTPPTAIRVEPSAVVLGNSLFRPSPIVADIWKMIRHAKVLVADLTGTNANVFYELGLAHAIGKPVVLLAETMDDVPFDLRSLRIIPYDKNHPSWRAKLKRDIVSALVETAADPASAVPGMFKRIVRSKAPTESKIEARLSALERRTSGITDTKFGSARDLMKPIEDLLSKEARLRSRWQAEQLDV